MGQTERRERVVAAAAQLFSEKRFDEVLMEEIAHQAQVGKGTLYTYFSDKEELYFAVVFEGICDFTRARVAHARPRLAELQSPYVSRRLSAARSDSVWPPSRRSLPLGSRSPIPSPTSPRPSKDLDR